MSEVKYFSIYIADEERPNLADEERPKPKPRAALSKGTSLENKPTITRDTSLERIRTMEIGMRIKEQDFTLDEIRSMARRARSR